LRRPDDSTLTPEQYTKVRIEAERALYKASALGRFPTPVDDIMCAAGVEEVHDDVLNDDFIVRMRHKAGDALKRSLQKVIGLFDAQSRLVFVDRTLHPVKQRFLRLHETGHGLMRWQCDIYVVVEECQQTLDPDLADQFDREANVFASEVLFQLDTFATEAEEMEFCIRTPIDMSKKYGTSIYAAIRQYVSKNCRACAVLVLNMPETVEGDGFRATLRRHVSSDKFLELFGAAQWKSYYTPDDDIGSMVPINGRRMSGKHTLVLKDRNGESHECVAEAFSTTYQVFILIHTVKTLTRTSIGV
jgi:hypothetical protein